MLLAECALKVLVHLDLWMGDRQYRALAQNMGLKESKRNLDPNSASY